MDAIQELMRHSKRMLVALDANLPEEELNRLLDGRQAHLDALAAAIGAGARATPEQTRELRRLDGDILTRLLDLRNALCGEMAALQMARAAGAAYRGERPATPSYLDRAG